MSKIVIQAKNPLDVLPDEIEELAEAIRITCPRCKVQVKANGYKGYAVTWYEVVEIAVISGVTQEVIRYISKAAIDWARERFKQKQPGRPKSITIFGPKGKVLKSFTVKNATEEIEDETEKTSGYEELREKYSNGRASRFRERLLGGMIMNKKWQERVEAYAILFVWVFGLLTATLTVIGTLPVLSEGPSLVLLISLIIFLIASLIVLVSDARRRWGKSDK